MRNDLFVFSAVDKLFQEFSGVNSLLIGLADERSENQLRHIFDLDILQIKMFSVFVLGDDDGFGIFHEFVVWSGVVLVWLLFVQ
jgi:hypothetical protein